MLVSFAALGKMLVYLTTLALTTLIVYNDHSTLHHTLIVKVVILENMLW